MSESLQALRRANPRANPGFTELVDSARVRIDTGVRAVPLRSHRRRARLPLAAAAVVASVAAALVALSPGGTPGVENATAAVQRAATVTAAAANRSGTVVVRITHDGQPWAGKTVRWNGNDVSITDHLDRAGRPGGELRVVNGQMYGPDVDGGWVELGPPESIDPGSGTTPTEQLAAVREDVGGVTLQRITRGMRGLVASRLADGSTVYRGTVAAGLIARESGFKEGERIRVFPFGYVAHDQASDPASRLDTAVTVGADGIVREIVVTWGTWTYAVAYEALGATPPPVAPENARPLRPRR